MSTVATSPALANTLAGDLLSLADKLRTRRGPWTDAEVALLLDTAFRSGLAHGYEQGYEAAETRLLDGLAEAMAGVPGVPMGEATKRHLRLVDQAGARREWRTGVADEVRTAGAA